MCQNSDRLTKLYQALEEVIAIEESFGRNIRNAYSVDKYRYINKYASCEVRITILLCNICNAFYIFMAHVSPDRCDS